MTMPTADVTLFIAASLLLIAAAMLVLVAGLLSRYRRQARSRRTVDRALTERDERLVAATEQSTRRNPTKAALRLADDVGSRVGESRFSDSLLAKEDRELVDLCGFEHAARARSRFIVARIALMIVLPVILLVLADGRFPNLPTFMRVLFGIFAGVALGYLIPKWALLRRASRRKRAADDELPLLIDLLKLLQGVGLSIDQSLQTIVQEFGSVMPVLTSELRLANEVHMRGRTREQSLNRLASSFGNDDLAAIAKLIAQVDRHGGAVQDPLTRFGDRVREKRKMVLKERIGKLTVKMTGVMVLTLLPGLLIVTGGPGILAVVRGLSRSVGV